MEIIAIMGFCLAGAVLGYVIGYIANPLVSMYRETITQLKADNKSLRMELDKIYWRKEEEQPAESDLTNLISDEMIEGFLQKMNIEMSVGEARALIPQLLALKKHL